MVLKEERIVRPQAESGRGWHSKRAGGFPKLVVLFTVYGVNILTSLRCFYRCNQPKFKRAQKILTSSFRAEKLRSSDNHFLPLLCTLVLKVHYSSVC